MILIQAFFCIIKEVQGFIINDMFSEGTINRYVLYIQFSFMGDMSSHGPQPNGPPPMVPEVINFESCVLFPRNPSKY